MIREKITVIIPAYNAKDTLETAVLSVIKQDAETPGCEPFRIIIIDDASTDGTYDIACKLQSKHPDRVSCLHNAENKGVAYSRNLGIKQAQGEYIAFLDADDAWRQGKLKAQLYIMEKIKAPMCSTARELFDEDMKSLKSVMHVPKRITYRSLLADNTIALSSVMIRADIIKDFEMKSGDVHEDYILWLEILRKYGYCLGIDKPYLKSRLSRDGKSRAKLKSAYMRFKSYRTAGIGTVPSALYFCMYAVCGLFKYRKVRIKL